MNLGSLLATLQVRPSAHSCRLADEHLDTAESEYQPWFVQAAIGAGMWLTTSFVVAMFDRLHLTRIAPLMAAMALALATIAVVTARCRPVTLFTTQVVWLAGLCAQMCLMAACEGDDIALTLLLALQVAAIFAIPSRSFRFLCAKNLSIVAMMWLGRLAEERWMIATPWIVASVGATLVSLFWLGLSDGTLARWRSTGLGLAAGLGWTLLFIATADVESDFAPFYRSQALSWTIPLLAPWLGALLVAVTVYAVKRRQPTTADWLAGRQRYSVAAPWPLIILACIPVAVYMLWDAPAILLGLLLVALGVARGERVLHAIGLVFAAGGLILFYYDQGTSLLHKSLSLGGLGLAALLLYGWLRRTCGQSRERERRPLRAIRSDLLRLSWGLTAALGIVLALVLHKQQILEDGQTVYLELRPLDPRSLIQGDYMDLRYEIEDQFTDAPQSGTVILELDHRPVGGSPRLWHGQAIDPHNECLLDYRKVRRRWDYDVRFGADSFLFEEHGQERYGQATYAKLKVSSTGEAVLVGLTDAQFHAL